MTPFFGELVGTALLILLGDGVVANVLLKGTKGENAGWIVITFGWGMAVFAAVFCVAAFSGAHINPAVTLGLAIAGKFPWADVPLYLIAQFIGGALGAFLTWLHYRPHFMHTEDGDRKLAVFQHRPGDPETGSELHFRGHWHVRARFRRAVYGGARNRPGRPGRPCRWGCLCWLSGCAWAARRDMRSIRPVT